MGEGSKRKKKMKKEGVWREEYASPRAMQPERRIIRISAHTKPCWLALDQKSYRKKKEKRQYKIYKTIVICSPYFISK